MTDGSIRLIREDFNSGLCWFDPSRFVCLLGFNSNHQGFMNCDLITILIIFYIHLFNFILKLKQLMLIYIIKLNMNISKRANKNALQVLMFIFIIKLFIQKYE